MTANVFYDRTEESSLEHVLVSEVYPMKQLVVDQVGLAVPFTPLCGECVEYLGRTSDGVIALSNYRLFIESSVNIPIGLIESVEYRDIFYLHIYSKDVRTVRCTFLTNDVCLEWYKRLLVAVKSKTKLQDMFAFAFSAWYFDGLQRQDLPENLQVIVPPKNDNGHLYSFGTEIQRLQFDTHRAWRITLINENFNICCSYPKYHLVPSSVSDKDLESIAGFRSSRRFPTVVWRDTISGAVLARASQPEVGWFGWRNTQDENFLQSVAASCLNNPGSASNQKQTNGDVCYKEMNGTASTNGFSALSKNVVIIDARSYAAAVANRAKGGGCECAEYYPNCEIMFMSLANIHTIRKSFLALRSLCAMSPELPGWLTNIENTKWLHHISGLLKASLIVVNAIDKEHRCVLVHCSDGWDRTPQIVALAELMLDPFYRTLEGFRILVEKEWLEFGHKFADRCGQGIPADDANERCPVFLQWLDCVHQLLQQFPCSFQFNEAFLVKLVQHTYSCLFGDFLCNTEKERISERVYQQTLSVWRLLCLPASPFVNLLYRPPSEKDRVLRPYYQMQSLRFWSSVYSSEMSSSASEDLVEVSESESTSSSAEASPDSQMPAMTRSCEDLSKEVDDRAFQNPLQRRLSDPNLARDFLPASLVLSEPNRVVPSLLCRDPVNGCDVSELSAAARESGYYANGVDKCPSVETLKGHEDDDRAADNGISRSVEQHKDPCIVNGELESRAGYCDTLNNNDGLCIRTGVGSTEAAAVECWQAPSTFEDSDDTLTGFSDLTQPISSNCSSMNTSANISPQNGLHSRYGDEFWTQNGAAGPGAGGSEGNPVSLDGSESAAAAAVKVMLEKCSSTSDLVRWESDNRHRANARSSRCAGTRCAVVNASDTAVTQQLAASGGPQQKVVAGVLSVDTSRSSPPGQSSTYAISFANFKELDLAGVHMSSGCSSTPISPSSEAKYLSCGMKQPGRFPRSQDFDGLTVYVDPVQQRIAQMKFEYDAQIRLLTRQLVDTRLMMKQVMGLNGAQVIVDFNRDEAASTDSGGERGSLGGGSVVTSDLSWEQVEEKDAQMTLWVPDHVVTHCAGCDKEFWVAFRKHHCRSCGHVFCDECTKYSIPVPQQQLLNPVRVCKKCFQSAKGDFGERLVLEVSRLAVGESISYRK